jgi:capsular exopolysaccharide synthesis family protein
MSIFFKALEQAERDRSGRVSSRPSAAPSVPVETWRPLAPESMPSRRPDTPVRLDGGIDEHLVSLVDPSSFAAEQYRALRHAIEQCRRAAGHAVFGIGSPSAGDGKTTTALNLAGALAQAAEIRVLLVEADLRRPQMAERLHLDTAPRPGLVQAIQRPELSIDDVVQHLAAYNLSVVLAGDCPASPYELLRSPRLGDLLQQARADYDYVILDTPPLVPFPDGRVIGNWVDAWLVVVAAHRTSRELLGDALDTLEPSKTLGFIFTHDERFRSNGRYYGGYYEAAHRRVPGLFGMRHSR